MPMNPAQLSAEIQALMAAAGMVGPQTPALATAIATAVVTHIVTMGKVDIATGGIS